MAKKKSNVITINIDLQEITLDQIKAYNGAWRKHNDYSNGGFYLITDSNENPIYVGKSVHVIGRLKEHYYNAIRGIGIQVDRVINQNFGKHRFFLITTYESLGINFFSSNLDTVAENLLIGHFNTMHPNGLNMVYHDKLRLK